MAPVQTVSRARSGAAANTSRVFEQRALVDLAPAGARSILLSFQPGFVLPEVTRTGGRIKTVKTTPVFEVSFRRKAVLGARFENKVFVDESAQLQELKREARELSGLPEVERIAQVIELVRRVLKYAYASDEALSKTFGELQASFTEDAPELLSAFIDAGVGRCTHFATLFEVLALEAGLKSSTMCGYATNFVRPDTSQPVFKAIPLGAREAHTWNEVYVEGKWIPVDATSNFVGLAGANLKAFKTNYLGSDGVDIDVQSDVLKSTRRTRVAGDETVKVGFGVKRVPNEPVTVAFDFDVLAARSLVEGIMVEIRK